MPSAVLGPVPLGGEHAASGGVPVSTLGLHPPEAHYKDFCCKHCCWFFCFLFFVFAIMIPGNAGRGVGVSQGRGESQAQGAGQGLKPTAEQRPAANRV